MAPFVDGRASFDRVVSREPLAVAANAARKYFAGKFGAFLPSFGGTGIVAGEVPALHEHDHSHGNRTCLQEHKPGHLRT